MSHSVLPPIRDILPGFLNEYSSPPSLSPSPSSSSQYQLPHHSSPHLPPLDTAHCRSLSECGHSLFPTKSRNRSPRSISSYIPTSSFQFNSSAGVQSPAMIAAAAAARQTKRIHTSEDDDCSATSDQSAGGQPSETETEVLDQQLPVKKRRREEKKHACPYCKKLFHRPVSLGVHINTHTGEKPYTCPFPNCSRQFNVNSNMRRHYRTHFTPGTIDLSQLTYSSADERFYVHAIAPTASTIGRGRYGPVSPYIPPMPSASYGAGNSPHQKSAASRSSPYGVSYVPIMYNDRSGIAAVDIKYSAQRRDPAHKAAFTASRSGDHRAKEPIRSVGRLKPASDWDLGSRGHHGKATAADDEDDDSDSDN